MNFAISAAIDLYSILLLISICIYAVNSGDRESLHQKLYIRMLALSLLILAADIFSRCDGHPGTVFSVLNAGGNFLIFLLGPLLPSVWLGYVHYAIFRGGKKKKRLRGALLLINAANMMITVLSQFFGWYYTIDAENVYHRGRLFWISPSIVLLLVAASLILVVMHHKAVEREYGYPLFWFPIPPAIGFFLQAAFYGVPFTYIGLTISFVVAYIHIQSYSVYTDFLTGAYNRKKLDAHMKRKIRNSTENDTFSAILVDIDNFKSINDTYGHGEGDSALETTVMLIKSCIRSSDLVARFGGDEFCVILDISDPGGLKATVQRILKCLILYNQQGIKPYRLSLSLGYAVYDYHSHLSVEAFQKQIDQRMYENKRANKELAPD